MKNPSITFFLATFRRRLRLRDGWLLAQRTSWMALIVLIGILGIGRLVPIHGLTFWVIAPIILWLCAVLGFTAFQSRSLKNIALEVDKELGLKERLSTAIELETQSSPQFTSDPVTQSSNYLITTSPNFQRHQHNDAIATAQSIRPRTAFPLYFSPCPMVASVGLLVTALVLIYLPNPMNTILAERAAVEQSAQEQANNIEEFKDEIEQSDELSPKMRNELTHKLEELAQQLRKNPGDREKALADLSRIEEELRRQIDPNASSRQTTLEGITLQLQFLAKREYSDSLIPMGALVQITSELANLSETKRQELAEALAQLAAQAAQSGDPSLAQSLASMSQTAFSGDSENMMQAIGEFSEALAEAQSILAAQSALQQSLNKLQESSQSIAQAGLPDQQTANQEPLHNNSSTQGQAPGQGNNQGQGQSGQGQSGGGTKADTLPPGTGSGQAGKPQDIDTRIITGDLEEQVFIPWERLDSESHEIRIPGLDTEQGQTIERENPNPSGGISGTALIPYQQVYIQYFEAAQQAINRNSIPPAYQDLVREYFTILEP